MPPFIVPALSSIWSFIKAHWQPLVLVLVVIVGYSWVRRTQADYAKTLVDMNTAHQVEIDQINRARADEQAQHQKELDQLNSSLQKIQDDYAAAQQQLQQRQTQETQQIVKRYGNDADGLASLFADKMGFVVLKSTP